jgi:hypothetical protein
MPPRKEARANASLFAMQHALLPEEELAAKDRLDLADFSGWTKPAECLRTPSPPDRRAVDRLADGEMALASGALVVRGDDRVHERVRADRVGEDDN